MGRSWHRRDVVERRLPVGLGAPLKRLASAVVVVVALATPAAATEHAAIADAARSVVSVLPTFASSSLDAEEPEGSGVVLGDGHVIVTGLHVVDGAHRVRVRSADGEIVEARILRREFSTDLALLEVDEPLPPATLGGDPDMGAQVCAIGNAFGLGLSVTCGVVSAVHKAGVGFNRIEDFVQTDAAVNPGASGGALVDLNGRVVGILSAIFTKTSDANIGINFAISAPLAKRVVESLIDTGSFRVPWMGMRLAAEPAPGETGKQAARVLSVAPGGPAEIAGVRQGDSILRAGDRRVIGPADMLAAVARLAPTEDLALEIERDGRETTVNLALSRPMGDRRGAAE